MRKVNALGLEKLVQWEGEVLYAYDDADTSKPPRHNMPGDSISGTLTIGVGHTESVKQGQVITKAKSRELLKKDLAKFEKRVSNLVKVPLTDNQFAALVSFDFNTGALHESTLLKKLNEGDYNSVPFEMNKWIKTTINGKKVRSDGLVNRRAAEIGLWATGSEVASNTVSAEISKPPIVTKENVTAVAAAGGGLATVADRLNIADMFNGTGSVQYAIAAMMVVSFVLLGFWFLQRRNA